MNANQFSRAILACSFPAILLTEAWADPYLGSKYFQMGLGIATSSDFRSVDASGNDLNVTDYEASASLLTLTYNHAEWSNDRFGLDFRIDGQYGKVDSDVSYSGELDPIDEDFEPTESGGRQYSMLLGPILYADFEGWRPFVRTRFGFYSGGGAGVSESAIGWEFALGSEIYLGEHLTALVELSMLGRSSLSDVTTGANATLYYRLNEKWSIGGYVERGWARALEGGDITGGVVVSITVE